MHILIDNNFHGPQEQGTVRLRPQRHPVVSAVGSGVVFRGNNNDAGTTLNTLQLPMRLRHLVFNEVLPPAGVQLGKTHVREVDIRPLHARPERL